MTKNELLDIAKSALAKYRAMPYSDLTKKVGALQPDVYSRGDSKDQDFYQMEVEVVYDNRESGNLRIIGMIDDGKGLSGIYNLIISPDGMLLSEAGSV